MTTDGERPACFRRLADGIRKTMRIAQSRLAAASLPHQHYRLVRYLRMPSARRRETRRPLRHPVVIAGLRTDAASARVRQTRSGLLPSPRSRRVVEP